MKQSSFLWDFPFLLENSPSNDGGVQVTKQPLFSFCPQGIIRFKKSRQSWFMSSTSEWGQKQAQVNHFIKEKTENYLVKCSLVDRFCLTSKKIICTKKGCYKPQADYNVQKHHFEKEIHYFACSYRLRRILNENKDCSMQMFSSYQSKRNHHVFLSTQVAFRPLILCKRSSIIIWHVLKFFSSESCVRKRFLH